MFEEVKSEDDQQEDVVDTVETPSVEAAVSAEESNDEGDSEGTRLGEGDDFDSQLSQDKKEVLSAELSGTKMGEVSEFEQSLATEFGYEPTPVEPAPKSEPVSAPVADDSEKSLFEKQLDQLELDFQEGDIVSATVRNVEKGGILVDLGYKSDGYIANNEYSSVPGASPSDLNPGDELRVVITKLETKEGYTLVSRKRAEYEETWSELVRLTRTKDVVDVQVTSSVESGLVVMHRGIKGFIPISHILKDPEIELSTFVGTDLSACVLQADRKRRKVVFSQKMAKTRPAEEDIVALLTGLEVGQVIPGTVSSVKDFGAFVDIGGVEGLVHISELSWSRVQHPSELVKVGDEVKVFVLGVDAEERRVSLGMKQLQPDPWTLVPEKYAVGQVIDGEVTRIVPFGAFCKIDTDLEGLIHISELANRHVAQVEDVVQVGQKVRARIIKLSPEEQRIGLSLKAVDEAGADFGDFPSFGENAVADSAEAPASDEAEVEPFSEPVS